MKTDNCKCSLCNMSSVTTYKSAGDIRAKKKGRTGAVCAQQPLTAGMKKIEEIKMKR